MTPALQTNRLLLLPMTIEDAPQIGALYRHPLVSAHYQIEPFDTEADIIAFVSRIISSSLAIWTIRLLDLQNAIIGDCALHHYQADQQSIQMGGTLFPANWGKHIMAEAIEEMTIFAKAQFNIRKIIFITSALNKKALRLAQKQGFHIQGIEEEEIELIKFIA